MMTTQQDWISGSAMPVVLRQDHSLTTTLSQQSGGAPVTITEVSPVLAQSAVFAEQFEPTMQAIAQISHPALLPVLDFGIKGDIAYVVHPYMTRGSLAGEVHMAGQLPLARMVDVITQLAEVVDTVHNHEIVHSGITASAVLRGPEDSVILGSLGLADLVYQSAGLQPGALPYAAPELLLKAPYTVRVDIYALGILGFQLLTGRLPFNGSTTTQYMHAHLRRPLPGSDAKCPDAPAQVFAVLKQAAGKLAHSRYWSAREMAHDLALAAGLPATVPAPRPARSLAQMITRYRSLRSVPGKQRGNLKVSQLYTEALLRENESPVEASQMYHQIIDLWPRMAQGDVLDRLIALERRMLIQEIGTIRIQAQRALNRGDWSLLLRASEDLLEVDAENGEGEQMHELASTMLAADEHYQAACLADEIGDTSAAVRLTRELFRAVPNFSDGLGLTVIEPHRAPYVHQTATSRAHESNILALEFSNDGRMLASGSTDKQVGISWLPRLETTASLDTFHSWVCTLAFSPDNDYLLTGLWDGEIRLWTLPDGKYHGMIAGLVNQMQSMVFAHHQPGLVAVAAGSFLTLWQIPSGDRVVTVREDDLTSISALAFAPTSPRLICGMTHGAMRIRDASQPDYPVISQIKVHQATIHGLACLPGGRRVASISHYDTAAVTDFVNGEVLFELRGHDGAALSIAASPTEPLIATGGADGTVRLWDADRGRPLAVLAGHGRSVSRVAISPDSRLIASADSGGTIRLWSIR